MHAGSGPGGRKAASLAFADNHRCLHVQSCHCLCPRVPLLLGRRAKESSAGYQAVQAVASDHERLDAAVTSRRRFSSAPHFTATAAKLAHSPHSMTIRKK